MRTLAIPDCFRDDYGKRKRILEEAKQRTGAERVIWLSFGSFEPDGNPSARSVRSDAEALTGLGADLVLAPPVIVSLDHEGTEIFAEAALISRLHCVDCVALPVSGAVPGEVLRKIAMFLFQELRDFQKEVKKERAAGKTAEEAKILCAGRFIPGADAVLADPVDGRTVEFLKCMYQLYLCVPVEWVPMGDGSGAEVTADRAALSGPAVDKPVEKSAVSGTAEGGSAERPTADKPAEDAGNALYGRETLYDLPGMDEAVYERIRALAEEGRTLFAARVAGTAGGTERIRRTAVESAFYAGSGEETPDEHPDKALEEAPDEHPDKALHGIQDKAAAHEPENGPATALLRAVRGSLADPETAFGRDGLVELRKFLVRLISGIRMEDSQMCSFYICCPYALAEAAADKEDGWLGEVRTKSWVPLLAREKQGEEPEEDESRKVFRRIEDAAGELLLGLQDA